MLNLTESWKESYKAFLEEENKRFDDELDNILSELTEAQIETTKGYNILKEYYNLFYLTEYETPEGIYAFTRDSNGATTRDRNDFKKDAEIQTNTTNVFTSLLKTLSDGANTDQNLTSYSPAATYTVQKFSDMKFPENIIFFLAQLIKWIRNVVLYFIERFKNLIRGLIGSPKLDLDASKLDFDLKKAKKLTQVATSIDLGKGASGVVQGWRTDTKGIELLEDSTSLAQALGIVKPREELPSPQKESIVVTIDLSRDLISLQELVDQFYRLFDNAYGSNNEKLFETDDLKIILDMFRDTIQRVKTGDLNRMAINGSAVEVSAINSGKVKQNLILTNANVENLKAAYVKTSNKIKDISRIINSKEMLMLSQLGVSHKLLSASTYEQMKRMLRTLPIRLKEAEKLEKYLNKMQGAYSALVKELQGMQSSMNAVSNITFDTVYNRRVIELLNAANWMSQIVTIRLAGLGVYIKELKDVRDALNMLAAINK